MTSDDPGASDSIDDFAADDERWLVSVLMVSEGVDIPRLRVGVYATAARTELFFRQVVGRFVRRTPTPARQMSFLFLPADPDLKLLAARVEEERRHALEQRPELEEQDAPVERNPTQGRLHPAVVERAPRRRDQLDDPAGRRAAAVRRRGEPRHSRPPLP